MNKLDISNAWKSFKFNLAKRSPSILLGTGIAGITTAGIYAVAVTPKAVRKIDKKREETTKKMTKMDKIKECWTLYLPSAIIYGLSMGCIISSCKVSSKRTAALATAYSLSETALKEYQNKVVETIGEKKEQIIKDSIAKDKVENNPVVEKRIVATGKGNTLFYESVSGRYFESDLNEIKKVCNNLNWTLRNNDFVSLNDLYYELGLDPSSIGDDLGWDMDKGTLEFEYSAQLLNESNPCIVIGYNRNPTTFYY